MSASLNNAVVGSLRLICYLHLEASGHIIDECRQSWIKGVGLIPLYEEEGESDGVFANSKQVWTKGPHPA